MEPQHKCKNQRGAQVETKWCDESQYTERCHGCKHDEWRNISKYQIEQEDKKQ